MAGDINIFLEETDTESWSRSGELNVMIAEEKSRRKGLATESVLIFMHYAIQHLGNLLRGGLAAHP